MNKTETITAVYLGVSGRGAPETVLASAASFRWKFSAGTFPLAFPPADPFRLPNLLKHGQSFLLTLENGVITDLAPAEEETPSPAFRNPFRGRPGLHTLKNFLLTALMPVGQALYVFGGGWNFQDTGSNLSARTIGLSPSWRRFFLSQSENYTYRDPFGDEKKLIPRPASTLTGGSTNMAGPGWIARATWAGRCTIPWKPKPAFPDMWALPRKWPPPWPRGAWGPFPAPPPAPSAPCPGISSA